MRVLRFVCCLLALVAPGLTRAGGGPFGIDHPVQYDNSGLWRRSNQNILFYGTVLSVGAGAVWLGSDDPLGNTLWRSADAATAAVISTQVLKWTFRRERPSQTDDPNRFFKGGNSQSFPSTEVATIAAAVTPLMATYGNDHPAVYLLALLPAYDAVARVKTHGHWQSDVVVGGAIGAGLGIWASRRSSPWIVSVLPGGFQLGFRHQFD